MDELITITKVSSSMNISSRTLRYWESAGLFTSIRDAQSGWRLYDEAALQCIRITDLLRRLDFSIKDIKEVMEKRTPEALRDVLIKQLGRLDKTRTVLDTRRQAIAELISMLDHEQQALTISSLESILHPVAVERKKHVVSKHGLQGGFSMGNIESKFDEVQIIKMPPMRTAAFSCVGTEPEDEAYFPVKHWIVENGLEGTMRIFGFNTEPYPSDDNPVYGFGVCATVPDEVEIPKPLYEMKLPGGIYAVISGAAYSGDPSYGWQKVHALCNDSDWEWMYDSDRLGLEEHIECANGKQPFIIPILFPVKKK
ncbi:MAG: MerR family transcriptional regulator [Defluviitaleaceae bacterium]|nr:MerR family transcriptional regulator [Defluviitaleaceae bacterium]